MFGEDDSSDDGVRLEKQEHIAKILMTIPANMKAKVSNTSFYYEFKFHREILYFRNIFHLLSLA
jgi:hypothetical protein